MQGGRSISRRSPEKADGKPQSIHSYRPSRVEAFFNGVIEASQLAQLTTQTCLLPPENHSLQVRCLQVQQVVDNPPIHLGHPLLILDLCRPLKC